MLPSYTPDKPLPPLAQQLAEVRSRSRVDRFVVSPALSSLSLSHTHTHTHTRNAGAAVRDRARPARADGLPQELLHPRRGPRHSRCVLNPVSLKSIHPQIRQLILYYSSGGGGDAALARGARARGPLLQDRPLPPRRPHPRGARRIKVYTHTYNVSIYKPHKYV